MSGPDFHYPQRRAAHPKLWRTPIMVAAFITALANFQRFPERIGTANAPAASLSIDEGATTRDALSTRFALCHRGGGSNCVVDGDTFWFAGDKYRIADVDAPETHPARCAEEAALGGAATERLRTWLNAGAFSLESAARDTDRYSRKLRVVTRGGTSVGSVLVAEGLARPWEGRRRPWC